MVAAARRPRRPRSRCRRARASRAAARGPRAIAGVIRDPDRRHARSTTTARCARSRAPTSSSPTEQLDELWTPETLERLARTYWRFLTHVTLGLDPRLRTPRASATSACSSALQAADASRRPSTRPTTTAASCAGASRRACSSPRGAAAATATWRSTSGAATATSPARQRIHVEVEVANFYPAIASRPRPLAVHQHAVADPRARHPRLPALAGAPRPRGVEGRARSRTEVPDPQANGGRHPEATRQPISPRARRPARAAWRGRGARGCAARCPSASA